MDVESHMVDLLASAFFWYILLHLWLKTAESKLFVQNNVQKEHFLSGKTRPCKSLLLSLKRYFLGLQLKGLTVNTTTTTACAFLSHYNNVWPTVTAKKGKKERKKRNKTCNFSFGIG